MYGTFALKMIILEINKKTQQPIEFTFIQYTLLHQEV